MKSLLFRAVCLFALAFWCGFLVERNQSGAQSALSSAPSWWAFRKPVRPPVPTVEHSAWAQNPIDAFIMQKLEAKGLKPAPAASKLTLVRRAYFDLLGLPPTPDEVRNFIEDPSPKAYKKLVDHLLASPHYGERWGRYWLDVVRYADSSGFEGDLYFPNAWRYRDYVIQSFNEDKPYNQFVQEQIAADEIWPNDAELEGSYILPQRKQLDLQRRIGTGFYTIGPMDPTSPLNGEQLRYERLTDMADTTGAAFLGLTIGCARCHDHKFDPIPQRDYYRLQAVFAGSEEKEIPIVDPAKVITFRKSAAEFLVMEDLRSAAGRLDDQVRKRVIKRLEAGLPREVVEAHGVAAEKRCPKQQELAQIYAAAMNGVTNKDMQKAYTADERSEREKMVRQLGEALLKAPKPYAKATVLGHSDIVPDVCIAMRGNFRNKGERVGPGFPSALGDGKDLVEPAERPFVPQRRKALALWLTQPDHPLTSRVMVNRIWQGHFGRGIVNTPNDFGRQGDPPTHPELLDWLATEFVARGWSVKAMHRLMMLSSTYQMSGAYDEANARTDPNNKYFWRMNRRRLEAEAVRDAVLASAGTLNLKMGGPPVIPPLSSGELSGLEDWSQWPATSDLAESLRRSVYLYSKRTFRIPLLETFDLPDSSLSCPRRDASNVAPQALTLMNNPFIYSQAQAFAARLLKENRRDPAAWVESGWRIALGRAPSGPEKQKALEMVARGSRPRAPKGGKTPPGSIEDQAQALTNFCLMVLNLNEFIYVD